MVEDREKFLVRSCREQVKGMLVALESLEPSTPRGKEYRDRAHRNLLYASVQLDSLYRHYCHYHHPKPPPEEGDHDLP